MISPFLNVHLHLVVESVAVRSALRVAVATTEFLLTVHLFEGPAPHAERQSFEADG